MTRSNLVAVVIFALAIVHTFAVQRFQHWARRSQPGSTAENLLHLLGEVEVVFGLWSAVLFLALLVTDSRAQAIAYFESRRFDEPLFVFAIMTVAATRPVGAVVDRVLRGLARALPLSPAAGLCFVALSVGPLFGSLVTEPAAMTVVALFLEASIFAAPLSARLRYAILGLLFVNVSIGGTLTHFAAPPIVMVAGTWGWTTPRVFWLFGVKALVAVIVNCAALLVAFRGELARLPPLSSSLEAQRIPWWVTLVHLAALALVAAVAHHPKLFVGVLLLFLGFTTVTERYQSPLRLRQALLVALFLAGLVIIGGLQEWWLKAALVRLTPLALFFGAAALTTVTDNAALTYLGSLTPLGEAARYALVAGAVAAGGLTVIANAPNPAGLNILQRHFGGDGGEEGVSPLYLFLAALPFTLVAALCFLVF